MSRPAQRNENCNRKEVFLLTCVYPCNEAYKQQVTTQEYPCPPKIKNNDDNKCPFGYLTKCPLHASSNPRYSYCTAS